MIDTAEREGVVPRKRTGEELERLTILLPKSLLERVRAISERQSIPMSILLRQWTAQSVEQVERAEREREP